jgi:hypothetical protein
MDKENEWYWRKASTGLTLATDIDIFLATLGALDASQKKLVCGSHT